MSFRDSLNKLRITRGGSGENKVNSNVRNGDEIVRLAHLAGYFGAHGIWSVSDGESLIPIFATESSDGTRSMARIEADELQNAVEQGKRVLERGDKGFCRAVLVYDSYVTLNTGKVDALTVEGRDYTNGRVIKILLPYRHASSDNGFRVHRPKFAEPQVDAAAMQQLGEAFFAGVDSHEKASAVWAEHLDESI